MPLLEQLQETKCCQNHTEYGQEFDDFVLAFLCFPGCFEVNDVMYILNLNSQFGIVVRNAKGLLNDLPFSCELSCLNSYRLWKVKTRTNSAAC